MFCCCARSETGELVSIDLNDEHYGGHPGRGTPDTFHVQLRRRSPDGGFNIGVGVRNCEHLVVMGVKEGPGLEWNKANKGSELKQFDRIMKVNDVTGNPQDLIVEMNKSISVVMAIKRPAERRVAIDRSGPRGKLLGLGLANLDGLSLFVKDVVADGLVHAWNEEHPGERIEKDYRVVEVNGVRDNSQAMLDQLTQCERLELLLQHH